MTDKASITVAIVEDDESVGRALGRLLRAGGLQSVRYASGEAFLADPSAGRFDCLILDVQLGGISGIELARTLAGKGHRSPVIFVTARDDPDTRTSADAAGCAAFLRKSDPGDDLLGAIGEVTYGAEATIRATARPRPGAKTAAP